MRANKNVESRLRGDTSNAPQDYRRHQGRAYDRATESLLKYIAITNAAAETVGKSVAEQEKAKAQLLAAAEKDGTGHGRDARLDGQAVGARRRRRTSPAKGQDRG
jgi:hypothetical protein